MAIGASFAVKICFVCTSEYHPSVREYYSVSGRALHIWKQANQRDRRSHQVTSHRDNGVGFTMGSGQYICLLLNLRLTDSPTRPDSLALE